LVSFFRVIAKTRRELINEASCVDRANFPAQDTDSCSGDFGEWCGRDGHPDTSLTSSTGETTFTVKSV
jgi:hypothetical protein